VSQPRIAAFARLANGNTAPKRVISGKATKLARTIHGIAYDAVHDEIYAPNPLADAILVFRGAADGAEPPIRVIQGPCTKLVIPHAVSLDVDHDEILVASLTGRSIAVFPRLANGNIAPLRFIQGLKTQLNHVVGLGVDPATNLLAVANAKEMLIFNRTDNGDVPPRAVIAGPRTGIGHEPWEIQIHKGRIFLASSNHLHLNLYSGVTLKDGYSKPPEDPWLDPELGFIGVWNITDKGDVAPRAMIKGPFSQLLHPTGLAIDSKHGEIYVTDSVRNGMFTFYAPEFFR
jgi:DNA-binding beta-propeller fold protein YncE